MNDNLIFLIILDADNDKIIMANGSDFRSYIKLGHKRKIHFSVKDESVSVGKTAVDSNIENCPVVTA